MTFLDLAVLGIETYVMDVFMTDSKRFRFRKGDIFAERIISKEELMSYLADTHLYETMLCRDALRMLADEEKKHLKPEYLGKLGSRVICTESGVVGTIIKFYKPTASEEQIMVWTDDGREYHAPARTWKLYNAETATTDGIMHRAKQTLNDRFGTGSLLNKHGEYVVKFAENHGISIAEAHEHPTVKAHLECCNKIDAEHEASYSAFNENFVKPMINAQKDYFKKMQNGG